MSNTQLHVQRLESRGFTLAEVLITLGIIGVVAALTIPAIIQSYKKQVATVRLKKFYSVMEQAIKLSEIDNGPFTNWEKGEQYDVEAAKVFLDTYLKPYLKIADVYYNNNNVDVYLADGSSFSIYSVTCMDIVFDMNGAKKPNIERRDRQHFLICVDEEQNNRWGFSYNQALKPRIVRSLVTDDNNISREKLLNKCKTGEPSYCTGLLMYDNWEFKDDYPYKL